MNGVWTDHVADRNLSAHSVALSQLNQITSLAPVMLIAAGALWRPAIIIAKRNSRMVCPTCARRPRLNLDRSEFRAFHIFHKLGMLWR